MNTRRTFRCAVYTRKSTDEGLEQDFNSLQAQREACEAFIRSQQHEGWKLLADRYDDGGYSGGTMDRPGLQALLAGIGARKIDVVVVYKIDRLTRSLTDFAKIVEVFEDHGVWFVSITQAFNTTTSMGRLTLNVLLSFAQFEREVTAERIRDKIAASKKKGMWMGGLPPLGYDVRDKQLIVNEAEAETVRRLFKWYLEAGSVRELKQRTDELGIVTKVRHSSSGCTTGGAAFSRGHLYRLLANPIYIGRIAHRGSNYPGRHQAIVDEALWEAVQQRLAANAACRHRITNAVEPSILTGLLFDETGDRLSPSHAVKAGRRYRYYISRRLMQDIRRDGDGWRLPARELERTVLNAIASFLRDRSRLIAELDVASARPDHLRQLLARAEALAAGLTSGSPVEHQRLLREMIDRINLRSGELHLRLDRSQVSVLLAGEEGAVPKRECADGVIDLMMPMALRRRGVEARLIIANGVDGRACTPDDKLIDLITKANAWLAQLTSGRTALIRDLALHEKLDAGDVSRILSLAFLAPDIVEAILDGRQPVELTAERLKRMCPLPLAWSDQRRVLGFDASEGIP